MPAHDSDTVTALLLVGAVLLVVYRRAITRGLCLALLGLLVLTVLFGSR